MNNSYRQGVGIMVLKSPEQVLVGQRNDITGDTCWQMPQGGIDKNEPSQAAALRELEEEMSVKSVRFITASNTWYAYDFPVKGAFKGQNQKWFAFHFDGTEDEINLQTSHPEFYCWRWMNFEDLLQHVVAFKKSVYQQVVAEFHPHILNFYTKHQGFSQT